MIGDLRERIILFRATPVPDAGGGREPIWTEDKVAFASIRAVPSGQIDKAGSAVRASRFEITTRYTEDIDLNWRISFQGRMFRILDCIQSKSPKRFLQISVEEAV